MSHLTPAVGMILAERNRQTIGEPYSDAHDDEHHRGELAAAAAVYAAPNVGNHPNPRDIAEQYCWPFDGEPKYVGDTCEQRIRELVKAGALIVAEIERLQRRSRKVESKLATMQYEHAMEAEQAEAAARAAGELAPEIVPFVPPSILWADPL